MERKAFYGIFCRDGGYRTLVDAKIFEIKRACGNDKEKIKTYLDTVYHIKL